MKLMNENLCQNIKLKYFLMYLFICLFFLCISTLTIVYDLN